MITDQVPRPGRLRSALQWVERPFSWSFGGQSSPAHFLGALSIYFLWITLVTGVYLFIFYQTSLEGAWSSVEALTHQQWYAGGVMRSLHRYASDAAIITLVLHLLRELWRGRHRGARWFSWLTGVPLIWIMLLFGISGYWMVWDELAQYVATSSAELLDWLPIFTDPMSRNFLSQDSVSSRLFTLIAFIHLVGLPIVVVLAIWFHLLRVRLPRINPPRRLMLGSLAALLVLALASPVISHAPANLDRVPASLDIDWFYLALFPLLDLTSAGLVWIVGSLTTLFLLVLPWLPPIRRPAVAEVHLPDCTGCGFCADDCPYGAIEMVPRSDGRNFDFEARVNAELCVGCGICTGACPSSSLFRARIPLTTGIDLPSLPLETLRQLSEPDDSAQPGALLVYGCQHGVDVTTLETYGGKAIALACIGQLPAAAIDFGLRRHAYAGVVVSGCDDCDCYHRLGNRWIDERLARQRPPALRQRVPEQRILVDWRKATGQQQLQQRMEVFRQQLDGNDQGLDS